MIKVLIKSEENKFKSLEVKGHANAGPYGEDLVCAAVSAILTGGFNNISDINSFDVKLDEGHAYLEAKEPISSHDEIVIEAILSGLKTIEESNPKNIKIQNL